MKSLNKVKSDWLEDLKWPDNGLLPAVAQDSETGQVLMVAWMNAAALQTTVEEGRAVYWSRSRQKLWRKGEESGHVQLVSAVLIDCDSDTIVLQVEQKGGIACHTGRRSCFYRKLVNNEWEEVEPVLKSPEEIYKS